MAKVLSSDKLLVPRSVVDTIFLAVLLISDPFSVSNQCKTLTMARESKPLIELRWQASSFSQSKKNTIPSRFSKLFAEPVLLGPGPLAEGVGEELFRLLPPLPEAIRLCEVYHEHGKYMQVSTIRTSVTQPTLLQVCTYPSARTLRRNLGTRISSSVRTKPI
jgi:hypothetical protein